MVLLLIPEKDYIISRFLRKESRFGAFEEAIQLIKQEAQRQDIGFIFDQPFHGLEKFQSLADFEYYDSHLAGRNYVTIFGFALKALGLSWDEVRPLSA